MKNKQLAWIQTSKMPLTMGLAFVAFTTQFGGGFASGAQIYQYFINYGLWCLLLPLVTQGLYAFFFWYGMRYSYRHKVYDYRAVSNSMYGKFKPLMSNLYELCYLIMIGTASAAAFATGGSTLNTLLGIPYWLCTFFCGSFHFCDCSFWNKTGTKSCFYIKCLYFSWFIIGTTSKYPGAISNHHLQYLFDGRWTGFGFSQQDAKFSRGLMDGYLVFLFPIAFGIGYVPTYGRCSFCQRNQSCSHSNFCL